MDWKTSLTCAAGLLQAGKVVAANASKQMAITKINNLAFIRLTPFYNIAVLNDFLFNLSHLPTRVLSILNKKVWALMFNLLINIFYISYG
jgi:hypothetical protein